MRPAVTVSLIVTTWVVGTEAARFLAFLPMPTPSHQRVFQPLLTELARRNHSVTVFTPLPLADPPPNYVQIKLGDYMDEVKKSAGMTDKKVIEMQSSNFIMKMSSVFWRFFGGVIAEHILKEEAVQRLISSDLTFDAIFLETTFLQETFIALGHKFNAPIIEIMPTSNSHWAYWIHGSPYDPSYICDFQLAFTDDMNFVERLQNTAISMWTRFVWWTIVNPKFENMMNEYIRYPGWENRPSMMEMVSNTSLVLVNTDIALNYPTPMSPKVKEVGGLNIFPPGKLPKDMQDFIDSAKDGVIYFTLGSHIKVSAAFDDLRDEFSRAFAKLKQKVLWKWEAEFPNPPENVQISKWFPQQEILGHKNVKLFISHGGFLSMTEAVYNGVPILAIPLLGDQYKNVAHIKHYEYGIHLEYSNLTETSISWAINEMLSNPKYKENVMKKSALLRDKPSTGLETAVYWVEYVLRHNGAHHLKPAVLKLSWWQASLIDVYVVLAAIIIIPLYLISKITCCMCRTIKSIVKGKKTTPKKKKE